MSKKTIHRRTRQVVPGTCRCPPHSLPRPLPSGLHPPICLGTHTTLSGNLPRWIWEIQSLCYQQSAHLSCFSSKSR